MTNEEWESYSTKKPLWTIGAGLRVIRAMQASLKPLGFHVALAGGVLNTDRSFKDLDLVFLPLTNNFAPPTEPLMGYLCGVFGYPNTEEGSHSPNPYTPYRQQWVFPNGGKRIDVFIV